MNGKTFIHHSQNNNKKKISFITFSKHSVNKSIKFTFQVSDSISGVNDVQKPQQHCRLQSEKERKFLVNSGTNNFPIIRNMKDNLKLIPIKNLIEMARLSS